MTDTNAAAVTVILAGAFVGFMHGLWWLLVRESGTWRDVWIMTAVGAVYYTALLGVIGFAVGLALMPLMPK